MALSEQQYQDLIILEVGDDANGTLATLLPLAWERFAALGLEARYRAAKLAAIEIAEAIARGGDRHGDGILVPVGHGALALALGLQCAVEPGVGGHHRLALQAAHRHIGAVSQNPLGHVVTPDPN